MSVFAKGKDALNSVFSKFGAPSVGGPATTSLASSVVAGSPVQVMKNIPKWVFVLLLVVPLYFFRHKLPFFKRKGRAIITRRR
jgi:hypothetical protein